MERAKHTLNELLVSLFNYVLYIEKNNINKGIRSYNTRKEDINNTTKYA